MILSPLSEHAYLLIRQKPLPNNLAGIRNQHKRRRLNPAYIITQLKRLAAFHGSHDDSLLMVGKCPFCVINRSAPVKGIDNVITDRIRVVADNVKAFAQIQVLDHIVNHKGLGGKSDGGEQPCLRPKDKEGGQNSGHVHQHQDRSYIKAGMLFLNHGYDICSAAGGADVEEDGGSDSGKKDSK